MSFSSSVYLSQSMVAPFTGAWIEISKEMSERTFFSDVAPFTGAWIEITMK